VPLACTPGATKGPCDVNEIFPPTLKEHDGVQEGDTLQNLSGFGRLHGVMKDPQNKYVNANFFAPGKLDLAPGISTWANPV